MSSLLSSASRSSKVACAITLLAAWISTLSEVLSKPSISVKATHAAHTEGFDKCCTATLYALHAACCILKRQKEQSQSLSQIHQNHSGVWWRQERATKTTPETTTRSEPMTAQTPIGSQVLWLMSYGETQYGLIYTGYMRHVLYETRTVPFILPYKVRLR